MPLKIKGSNHTEHSLKIRNINNSGRLKFSLSNASEIVPDGLLLYLDAGNPTSYNGSGTTWYDLSPNSNNGTSVQSPTYSSNDGGYFSFDGGDISATIGSVDSFSIADSVSLDSMTAISIIMWFYITSIPDADPNLLFTKRGTTSNGLVGFYTQTFFRFRIGTGSPTQLDYSSAPSTGVWQQIAVTVGASGGKIYKNGSEVVNNVSYTGNFADINTTSPLLIGDCNPISSGVNGFKGRMSIFKIYSKILSAAEILQDFNNNKSRYGL